MNERPDAEIGDGCSDCPWTPDRRAFIRHASLAALGAILSAGVPADAAAAMVPRLISSRRTTNSNPTYSIPADDGVHIDTANEVILVRWKHSVFAFNLACPHQNVALRWNAGDTQFQCPKHHSKYQQDGTFISGRATRNMDRFSVTRSGNDVVVNVGAMHKSDADHAACDAAVLSVTTGSS